MTAPIKNRTLAQLLHVSQNASDAEINTAYRRAGVSCHPDRIHTPEEFNKAAKKLGFSEDETQWMLPTEPKNGDYGCLFTKLSVQYTNHTEHHQSIHSSFDCTDLVHPSRKAEYDRTFKTKQTPAPSSAASETYASDFQARKQAEAERKQQTEQKRAAEKQAFTELETTNPALAKQLLQLQRCIDGIAKANSAHYNSKNIEIVPPQPGSADWSFRVKYSPLLSSLTTEQDFSSAHGLKIKRSGIDLSTLIFTVTEPKKALAALDPLAIYTENEPQSVLSKLAERLEQGQPLLPSSAIILSARSASSIKELNLDDLTQAYPGINEHEIKLAKHCVALHQELGVIQQNTGADPTIEAAKKIVFAEKLDQRRTAVVDFMKSGYEAAKIKIPHLVKDTKDKLTEMQSEMPKESSSIFKKAFVVLVNVLTLGLVNAIQPQFTVSAFAQKPRALPNQQNTQEQLMGLEHADPFENVPM